MWQTDLFVSGSWTHLGSRSHVCSPPVVSSDRLFHQHWGTKRKLSNICSALFKDQWFKYIHETRCNPSFWFTNFPSIYVVKFLRQLVIFWIRFDKPETKWVWLWLFLCFTLYIVAERDKWEVSSSVKPQNASLSGLLLWEENSSSITDLKPTVYVRYVHWTVYCALLYFPFLMNKC